MYRTKRLSYHDEKYAATCHTAHELLEANVLSVVHYRGDVAVL